MTTFSSKRHQLFKIRASQQMELQTSTWAHFNKAEYTATLVACGWAGAVLEKVKNAGKENSRKSVRWSAVPVPNLRNISIRMGLTDRFSSLKLYFETEDRISRRGETQSMGTINEKKKEERDTQWK